MKLHISQITTLHVLEMDGYFGSSLQYSGSSAMGHGGLVKSNVVYLVLDKDSAAGFRDQSRLKTLDP